VAEWLEAALCLGLFPVFLDLLQGQDAILLLFIVAGTFNRLHAGKDIAAGVILASGLFKFHLVLPIAIMLWLAGRSRLLAGFLPGAATLIALSCAVSGPSVLFTYPKYLLDLNRATGVGVVTAQSMPNLRGLLTAVLGRAPYPGPIHWLLLPIAVVAIVLTARFWRPIINTGFPGLALGYCLSLLVAIVTSYYVYSYDMTLLIIPLLLLSGPFLAQPSLSRVERRMIAAGVLIFAMVFTRYDGWIIGAAVWLVIAVALFKSDTAVRNKLMPSFAVFTAITVAGPLLWFWYNAKFQGDWLDFLRGPYSAAAIDKKTSPPGSQHYRGWHSPVSSLLIYMRTAQVVASAWETGFAVTAAALAGAWLLWKQRAHRAALLLWVLFKNVYPVPDFPNNLWPYVALAWVAASWGLMKLRPALVGAM